MYQYTEVDQAIVDARVAQFAEQTQRFLDGKLSDENFRALRLQNGLYIQRHAPMLRVAIPYGTLSSVQLRKLADIGDQYDRSYGHFTTRQNIQFNWPELEKVPEILGELAKVQMHAIQTSGNCIRNTTTDPLAGTVPDEAIDPRVVCELIRQWSTFHPEYAYLPRKFKIAVTATEEDRAAIEVHDIGIRIRQHAEHGLAFDLWVGGGLGRTPVLGKLLFADLPLSELRNWLEATLRVYNLAGRRDNKYKSRIKILVNAMGIAAFRDAVSWRYHRDRRDGYQVTDAEIESLEAAFAAELHPSLAPLPEGSADFERWLANNTLPHRSPGHRSVLVSLKRPGTAHGDLSSELMRVVADLADDYSLGELRITHEQNIVLPHIAHDALLDLHARLDANGLAYANRQLITDSIVCPGLDFCSLANAPTLILAEQMHDMFGDLDEQREIGPLEVKMSGCMNACGHHHIGHIGVLGVDKKGVPWYQITIGGRDQQGAALGQRIGPAVELDEVVPLIRRLVDVYLAAREDGEWFVDYVDRVGVEPFKEAAYAVR